MTSLTWWLILLVTTILAELSSPGLFFFLSFSIGAAVAALLSWFEVNLILEFAVFLVTSLAAFIYLRRYVSTMKDTLHATNVYALIGKKGVVTEQLSDCKKGWVKVEGELWAALPLTKQLIEEGAQVEVVSAAGSHVVVKKIEGHC